MKPTTKTILMVLAVQLVFLTKSISQTRLDEYISEGIENNLLLKEKHISLDNSLLSLKEARSYFLPSMDFGANYTLASGGRAIILPLGDLLNGVYTSLNTLLDNQVFPQLENVNEQFMPNNFYDARVRVSYPIFNPDIHYNRLVSEQQVKLADHEVAIFKAALTKDIKLAYFQFCLAYTSKRTLEAAMAMVEQNLKDNQSLLANGKALPAQVLRAESEVENLKAQIIAADNHILNASSYVNFLINRPIDWEVVYESLETYPKHLDEWIAETDFDQRAEKLQMETALNIQSTILRKNQRFMVPRLNAFVDLGMQGFDWDYSSQARYVMAGINLTFPIFEGGRNRLNIAKSQNDIKMLQTRQAHLDNAILMGIANAKNNIRSAESALQSAEKNRQSAAAYLRLTDRSFKEGTSSLIEFIDARNQYTQSELQLNYAKVHLLIALAELERELTTYP